MHANTALPDLRSFTLPELTELLTGQGEAKFRAKQVFAWLQKPVRSFEEMTNLPLSLREKLGQLGCIRSVRIAERYISKKDGTVKYLLELDDGECVESVVMRYHHGLTICISSQVGCAMGCNFCASTIGGKKRNLTAGEILGEVIFVQQDIGERIGNIVMMGIGEPLDNLDQVSAFLENVNRAEGLGIGYRHISLSTCGLVDGIDALAKQKLPITLSISLHAVDDEMRSSMMPVNRKYPLSELLAACRRYQASTGRRISFEYAMIDGVNDTPACAEKLARLLEGLQCHVNLIPVNPVRERNYRKSKPETIQAFIEILQRKHIPATVRRELGSDISASCGQLRQKRL